MLNYIAELGYQSYIKRFDNYYEEQNKLLERNKDFYE